MFSLKSLHYHKHLTIIASLIAVLCIIVLVSFRPVVTDNVPNVKTVTHIAPNLSSDGFDFPTATVDGAPNRTIQIDVPEELPYQEFESEQNLACEYNNGILHVWYKEQNEKNGRFDYQIKLGMNIIKIYRGNKLVGKLSYKTSLGNIILKDNE